MKATNDIFLAISFFCVVIALVFIIARYTYLIKKAMIERGLSNDSSKNKFRYIDLSCIILGVGVGLLVSSIFTTMDLLEDTMDLLVWGTILIFGALGLLMAHYLKKKFE